MPTGDSSGGCNKRPPPPMGRAGVTGSDNGAIMAANPPPPPAVAPKARVGKVRVGLVEKDQDQSSGRRMRRDGRLGAAAERRVLSPTIANEVAAQQQLRRRKQSCCESSSSLINAPSISSNYGHHKQPPEVIESSMNSDSKAGDHHRKRRRRRVDSRDVERSKKERTVWRPRAIVRRPPPPLARAGMWPSWRQLLAISLLSILITSMLANLSTIWPSSPSHHSASTSCLFKPCQALTIATADAAEATSADRPRLPMTTANATSGDGHHQASIAGSGTSRPTNEPAQPVESSSAASSSSLHSVDDPLPPAASAQPLAAEKAPRQVSVTQQDQQLVRGQLRFRQPQLTLQKFGTSSSERLQQQQQQHQQHFGATSYRQGAGDQAAPPSMAPAMLYQAERHHPKEAPEPPTQANDQQQQQEPPTQSVQVRSGAKLEGAIVVGRPMVRGGGDQDSSQQTLVGPPAPHQRQHQHRVSAGFSFPRADTSPLVPILAPAAGSSTGGGAIKVIAAPSLAAPTIVASHHQQQHHPHHQLASAPTTSSPAHAAPPTNYDTRYVASSAHPRQPTTTSGPNYAQNGRQPMMVFGNMTTSKQQHQVAATSVRPQTEPQAASQQQVAAATQRPQAQRAPQPLPVPLVHQHHRNLYGLASGQRDSLAHFMDGPGFGFGPPPPGPITIVTGLSRPAAYHAAAAAGYTAVPLGEHLLNEHIFPAASMARPLLLRAATQELPALLAAAATHHRLHHQPLVLPAGYQLVPASQMKAASNKRPCGPLAKLAKKAKTGGSKMVPAGSQSAPSISLPPLSHLLAPRNPFRLFSSSSAHARYRSPPSASSNNNKQTNEMQPPTWMQMVSSADGWSPLLAASPSAPMPSKAFQGAARLVGLEQADEFGGTGSGGQVFAQSHSAEQLEKLVRAASQASGGRAPTILPAIVEAPTGNTYPGLYIPALESESESQVSELKWGEQPHHQSQSQSTLISKIPGTDYILHPDEVRAMINIGESAWRHQESSGGATHQQASEQREVALGAPWRGGGLMLEDHGRNLRDFAYVEPPKPRDQAPASSNQISQNASFVRASFPAVIRLNDQAYVHLPLIRLAHDGQSQQPVAYQPAGPPIPGQRVFALLAGQPRPAPYPPAPAFFGPPQSPPPFNVPYNVHTTQAPQQTTTTTATTTTTSTISNAQMPRLVGAPSEQQQQRVAAAAGGQSTPPENSPVRLATQLTPGEINQVEESIIEALLISQQLDRQRAAAARNLAAAASQQHHHQLGGFTPLRPFKANQQKNMNKHSNDKGKSRFKVGGLFGRRQRRRRQSAPKKKQVKPPMQAEPTIHLDFLTGPMLFPQQAYLNREQQQLNAGESAVLESKLGGSGSPTAMRPPVLLADQETNKPQRDHHRTSELLQDAPTERQASSVALAPSSHSRRSLADCPQTSVGGGGKAPTEEFGSRVRAGCPPPSSPPAQESLAAASSSSTNQRRRHRQRVYVDWPGEASDADYFPRPASEPAALRSREKEHQRRPHQSAASNQEPSARLQQQQPLKFVPSQLKLQFAQDYQAREGVPIYNNNVRAAGALDRQRQALVQHLGSRPRHQAAASASLGSDGSDEDREEDDDDRDEPARDDDLQLRAAKVVAVATTSARNATTTTSPQTPSGATSATLAKPPVASS